MDIVKNLVMIHQDADLKLEYQIRSGFKVLYLSEVVTIASNNNSQSSSPASNLRLP